MIDKKIAEKKLCVDGCFDLMEEYTKIASAGRESNAEIRNVISMINGHLVDAKFLIYALMAGSDREG